MEVILKIENLYKVFGSNPDDIMPRLRKGGTDKTELLKQTGNTVGLNDVNLEVYQGEIFVVMGLSGSGKSTLVRCINRLIEPTHGRIFFKDQSITEMDGKSLNLLRRKNMSMVFQSFALLPHRSVLDNVAFGLELMGVDKKERRESAAQMLATVGLEGYEDSMPSELSGGMQQRVGLARALCTQPDILLMDEAFSALDPLIRNEMQDELTALQHTMRKTIIFITHDLDEALKIGDRIAIMKDGAVVQVGTPEEILKDPADDYVRDFVQNVNRARVITASAIMKRPRFLTIPKEGPNSAVKIMRDNSISSLFVVGADKTLKGVISIEKALQLAKNKENNIESVLDPVLSVAPDTVIDDILPMFLSQSFPIAVVNEENKLKGILFKSSVISGISKEEYTK